MTSIVSWLKKTGENVFFFNTINIYWLEVWNPELSFFETKEQLYNSVTTLKPL